MAFSAHSEPWLQRHAISNDSRHEFQQAVVAAKVTAWQLQSPASPAPKDAAQQSCVSTLDSDACGHRCWVTAEENRLSGHLPFPFSVVAKLHLPFSRGCADPIFYSASRTTICALPPCTQLAFAAAQACRSSRDLWIVPLLLRVQQGCPRSSLRSPSWERMLGPPGYQRHCLWRTLPCL